MWSTYYIRFFWFFIACLNNSNFSHWLQRKLEYELVNYSMLAYLGVSPIQKNGSYYWADIPRVVLTAWSVRSSCLSRSSFPFNSRIMAFITGMLYGLLSISVQYFTHSTASYKNEVFLANILHPRKSWKSMSVWPLVLKWGLFLWAWLRFQSCSVIWYYGNLKLENKSYVGAWIDLSEALHDLYSIFAN